MSPRTQKNGFSAPAWLVLFAAWLVPGYGFFHHGLRARAIVLFVLIEATFVAGLVFHGCVLFPEFNYFHEGFNLVSILTFVTQLFNGFLAVLAALPDLPGVGVAIFPVRETSQWSDLGSFYLLVSGGLNYFALAGTYDHFYGRKRREVAS